MRRSEEIAVMPLRWFYPYSILAATLLLLLTISPAHARKAVQSPREASGGLDDSYVGKPVPPFSALTTTGRKVSTEQLPRALIIDLWGLNCGSCMEEIKHLEELYREFKGRGLEVWAVNTEGIAAGAIDAGLEERGLSLSFDLLPDPDLEVTRLFTTWFIPVTVLVDSDGVVQYYKVGFNEKDLKKIRAKVGTLLE